tara:strand:+ start:30034 stop:30750 length:717 start_codon:yes stop_codon:yes gene_type:complete
MFDDKQWPEGFVFPACSSCNSGTRLDDELIGLMVLLEPFDNRKVDPKRMDKLFRSVNMKYPHIGKQLIPTTREARIINKQLGIIPSFGHTHAQSSGIKIPPEFHNATRVLAYKLSKGMYYKETGSIFPNSGYLFYRWFSNIELVKNGSYAIFDMIRELHGFTRPIIRNGKHLNNQFNYKITFTKDNEAMLLQAIFGFSFSFLVIGAVDGRRMEQTIAEMEKSIDAPNPFVTLQNPTHE